MLISLVRCELLANMDDHQTLDRDVLFGAMDATDYNRICNMATGIVPNHWQEAFPVVSENDQKDSFYWAEEALKRGPHRGSDVPAESDRVLFKATDKNRRPMGIRVERPGISGCYSTPKKQESYRGFGGASQLMEEPEKLKGSKDRCKPPSNHDDIRVNANWPYRQGEVEDCKPDCGICRLERDLLSGHQPVVRSLRFGAPDDSGRVQRPMACEFPLTVTRSLSPQSANKRRLCSIFIQNGDLHVEFKP